MTVNDIAHLRILEIKGLSVAQLEAICSHPCPSHITDTVLALRWEDARYALSLKRAPRRPY